MVRGIQADLDELPANKRPGTVTRAATTEPLELTSPTVFISWAHSQTGWDAASREEWQSAVCQLAITLREMGIDADMDLFHLDEPVDWTRFGPRRIEQVDRVIIVMSKSWSERYDGKNSPDEGAGAAKEADTLHGLFNRSQELWQTKSIIAMLPGVDGDTLPLGLERLTRVAMDPFDPESYENLMRLLTRQPKFPKPPLGTVRRYESAIPLG